MRALLDQGASASGHADATSGATALHECLLHGMSKMARLLLEHGASASARDRRGNTPLRDAAASGTPARRRSPRCCSAMATRSTRARRTTPA